MIASQYFDDAALAVNLLNDFLSNTTSGDQYPPVFAQYRLAELKTDSRQELWAIQAKIPTLEALLITYDPLSAYIRKIKAN